jgi:hypothetical protein
MTGSLTIGIDPRRYDHSVVLRPDGKFGLQERIANEATLIETLVDSVAEPAGGR